MDKDNKNAVYLLNTLLANEYVLYTKTRNAEWNLSGPNYYELHKSLQIQYGLLDAMIAVIAEWICSWGYLAMGSLKNFLCITQITEDNLDFGNPTQVIQTLITDHDTNIQMIRNVIIPIAIKNNDFSTTELVTGLMEQHNKIVCMLRPLLAQQLKIVHYQKNNKEDIQSPIHQFVSTE